MSDDKNTEIPEKNKDLTLSIEKLKDRGNFFKRIFFFAILFIFVEIIIGIGFNHFFSESLEKDRKNDYLKAWNNYLLQKWKTDVSTISGSSWGNKWQKVFQGNTSEFIKNFEENISLKEDYDLISVYLKSEEDLAFSLKGNNEVHERIYNEDLIFKLYELQSEKSGIYHDIIQDKNGQFYILSISGLCDNKGKPIYPGIIIFATRLERFLEYAEEIIPVKLIPRSGDIPENIYFYFPVINKLGNPNNIYIEVEPQYRVKNLVFNSILFFLLMQLITSLGLYYAIAPGYIKRRTNFLESMILESEKLNKDLTDKIKELNISRKETEESEAKYRHLIESSKDVIFSFSNNGFIITANKALLDLLGIKKENLLGKHFFELIHNPEKRIDILEKELLMQKFEELQENKSSLSFEMNFSTKNKEPITLEVNWEYVPIGDSFIVIGKAFTDNEDSMLQYFHSEKKNYVIKNYITLAEQITLKITVNLKKYLPDEDIFPLRICVREIIINAIEHGNLNIDFEEKTKLKESQKNYFKFIRERQNNPLYKNKKVRILYSLTPKKLSILITDEGKGFNYQKYLDDNANTANENSLSHGRGIFMTKNIFNKIKYYGKGNKVLLIKYLK